MFRPLRLAGVAALSIVIASPPAYANKWLAWLEELSGPGAFDGKIRWGVEVGCLTSPATTEEMLAILASTKDQIDGKKGRAVAETYAAIREAVQQSVGRDGDAKARSFLADIQAARLKTDSNADAAEAYRNAGSPSAVPTDRTKYAVKLLLDALPSSEALTPPTDQRKPQQAAPGTVPTTPPTDDPIRSYEFVAKFRENLSSFNRCAVDRSNNLLTIQIEAAWLTDGRLKNRRDDGGYPGYTRAVTVSAIGYLPVGRVLPLIVGGSEYWSREVPKWGRAVEVGTGVGTIGLSGTTIEYPDQWRFTIPLRARVIPSEIIWLLAERGKKPPHRSVRIPEATKANRIRRMLQSIQYHYGADVILGRIDNQVYSDAGPRPVTLRNEVVESRGVTIDIGTLIRARAGR